MTGDTVCYYRAVTRVAGVDIPGPIASIRTGDLPAGTPPLTRVGDGHSGFIVVPILGVSTMVTIINAKGEVVWYHTDDRKLDFYRARPEDASWPVLSRC